MQSQRLGQGSYTRQFDGDGDRSVIAIFEIVPVQDMAATEAQGRPIFRDEERVNIIIPGNNLSKVHERVTDEHRQRWPREYEAFRQGTQLAADGLPLEEWAVLTKSQVLELRALEFRTVEDIATCSDTAIQRIGMGGRSLKNRARAYLDEAAEMEQNEKLTAENDKLTARCDGLEARVSELSALLDQVHSQLQMTRDAPHPMATAIPGLSDPIALAAQGMGTGPVAQSSLDAIGTARRGRPRKVA